MDTAEEDALFAEAMQKFKTLPFNLGRTLFAENGVLVSCVAEVQARQFKKEP